VTDAALKTRELRPLLLIGIALLFWLNPMSNGWDLLPDWFGWLLILAATSVLTRDMANRGPLMVSAALSVVAFAAMWPPQWLEAVEAQDAAIKWSLQLPSLIWLILFCLTLATRAQVTSPGDSFWWRMLSAVEVVVGVLSVLVLGGHVDSLTGLLGQFEFSGRSLIIVMCFVHSGRDWAVVRVAKD
jgi:hypothetical protein